MDRPRILCIIPARFASTRLPGKPLALIGDKPLVMWAYDQAVAAGVFSEVCVATDDARIETVVRCRGGNVAMTSPDHASGTDRVNEVAARSGCSFVVNLQGDEPEVPVSLLREFADRLVQVDDGTLLTCVTDGTLEQRDDPSVVKVVVDAHDRALYFSRSAIPFDRSGGSPQWLRHIGIYGFSSRGLQRFCELPRGRLETTEMLEQLRALEHGMTIRCLRTEYQGTGIDTPHDLERFRQTVARRC